MLKRLHAIALLLVSFSAVSLAPLAQAAPQAYDIDPVHSRVDFLIRHMFSKVSGGFTKFQGRIVYDPAAPASSSAKVEIDASSINTANDHRDADLRSPNFFDVAKYPTITFTSGKITPAAEGKMKVEGTLTMHGVSKPVVLDAAFLGAGPGMDGVTRAGFEGTTKVDRKDFAIVWNKTLDQGTLLGDEVTINLQIEAVVSNPEPKDASQETPPAKEGSKEAVKPAK